MLEENSAAQLSTSTDSLSVKEEILQAVEQSIGQYPALQLTRQKHTDLEVESRSFDENTKLEYSAYLLLQEDKRTAVFWEMIWDNSTVGFIAGFRCQKIKHSMAGKESIRQKYDEEYAKVREVIKNIVVCRGWNFQTAVFKRKAMYPELSK